MNEAVRHILPCIQGYLMNSLWQLPLLLVTAWAVTLLLQTFGAKVEHRVWAAVLLLEGILPACSLDALPRWIFPHSSVLAGRGNVSVVVSRGIAVVESTPEEMLLSVAAFVYSAGILFFLGKLLWRIAQVEKLRREATPTPLPPSDHPFWQACCQELHVRFVQVAVSPSISGPVTVGWRSKMLLLPPDFATFDPIDRRVVLAHELAHMARNDFAWNLVYELFALAPGYHPVFWVTRRKLTESRELACDEMAASLVAGRVSYARSLLRMASAMLQKPSARKSHALGIFEANTFERRIMKLTTSTSPIQGIRRAVCFAACAVISFAACGSALALRLNVYPVEAAPASGVAFAGMQHPLEVPSRIMAENCLHRVKPVYPPDAKSSGIQGTVRLHAVIGKGGEISHLDVISGPKELRQSALDAVSRWTYQPYLLNGNPTEVTTTVTVNYSLKQ